MYSEDFLNQMGTDTDEKVRVLYDIPDGASDEECQEIKEYADMIKDKAEAVQLDLLSGYDWVKDKLILRPIWKKKVKENHVYKDMGGDVALVLYAIVLDDRENGILNTAKVPKEIAENWGVPMDVVWGRAMQNTFKNAEPRIYSNIFDIEGCPHEESALLDEDFVSTIKPDSVALLTTTRKTNGAIALFYDGVREKIAELYGGSYFVVFTSVHEAMIHREGSIEPYSIKRNLTETNRIFGEEDTLTESVFYYNAETKEFSPWEI